MERDKGDSTRVWLAYIRISVILEFVLLLASAFGHSEAGIGDECSAINGKLRYESGVRTEF